MYEIAIVEDNAADADQLQQFLERYAEENETDLHGSVFPNAYSFMNAYHYQFDIVLMDIDLPDVNGVETAKWLRERDTVVTLIFVTRLAQYAVNGYEVDALDYMVKPIQYAAFGLKLHRAIRQRKTLKDLDVRLEVQDGTIRVSSDELMYAVISNHHIRYHLTDGEYKGYGTLKELEEQLPEGEFFRCNSSCTVNLRYVEKIKGPDIYVDGEALGLSRLRKKDFMEALLNWQSGAGEQRDRAFSGGGGK